MWLRRCHARPEAPVNDDLLEQFIAEARDLLVEAGEDLLALERAPTDKARINRLFRSVHTLKGSSCLFDMPGLTQVLHAGEDLFEAVRERGLALTPEMVDATLRARPDRQMDRRAGTDRGSAGRCRADCQRDGRSAASAFSAHRNSRRESQSV
jgi:chemotaxis protein histidine kinase CheA